MQAHFLVFNMNQDSQTLFTDYLPDDHEYLTYIKKVLRHRCRQAGFRRISTALVESAETIHKIFGGDEEDLDKFACLIRDVENQTKGVVRFDSVLSLARSYVENGMSEWAQPVELYYIDPFLRKNIEGNLSTEIDFGVQVVGSSDPALTAQVIFLAHKILDDLGLRELYTVQINHIGSFDSRKVFLEDLKNFYFDKQRSLCEKCIKNNEKGDLLQLLRCDEEDCSILAQLAPKLENYLNKEDQKHYDNLKSYLEELGVEHNENKGLFGMGNYNAHTVFEFWHNDKGSKQIVFAGGSNDEMVEKLGGEKVNMIGFSSNTRTLIEGMKEGGIRVPHKDHLQVFVAQLGINAKKKALSLLQQLREAGFKTVGAMGTGSMRTQLDMANDFQVKYTILMGEVEVREGMVIVRDMKAGTQESVPYGHVVEILQERIGKEKLDVMEEGEKSVDLK